MNDDELLQRLRRSAPSTDHAVHPASGDHAASLMEQIMTTPVESPSPDVVPTTRPRRRSLWAAVAGGVAAVAAAAIAFAALGGGSEPVSVTYSLGAVDPTMGMCISLDEFVPSPDMLGFGGTVTSVEGSQVTVEVDRWYRGGPADVVVLDAGSVPSPALDGIEFVVGQRYLVSIINGEVGICGTSGPATPEYEELFASWFA